MPSLSCVYSVSMDLSQQTVRGQPGCHSRLWLVGHLHWKEWVFGGSWAVTHSELWVPFLMPVACIAFLISVFSLVTEHPYICMLKPHRTPILTSQCMPFARSVFSFSQAHAPPLSYLPVLDSFSTPCLMSVLLSLTETFQSSLWCLELHREQSFG